MSGTTVGRLELCRPPAKARDNRADNAYIPGAVIPGYVIIKPDFPECIDDFGFLWFEDEAVVAGSASWWPAMLLTQSLKN
jgi:hypothetical protein